MYPLRGNHPGQVRQGVCSCSRWGIGRGEGCDQALAGGKDFGIRGWLRIVWIHVSRGGWDFRAGGKWLLDENRNIFLAGPGFVENLVEGRDFVGAVVEAGQRRMFDFVRAAWRGQFHRLPHPSDRMERASRAFVRRGENTLLTRHRVPIRRMQGGIPGTFGEVSAAMGNGGITIKPLVLFGFPTGVLRQKCPGFFHRNFITTDRIAGVHGGGHNRGVVLHGFRRGDQIRIHRRGGQQDLRLQNLDGKTTSPRMVVKTTIRP